MLKFNIRLTDDNFKQEEIVWGEKYLAPDLSFVSGVASQEYHLERNNKIAASNTISHTPNSVLNIETENVTREGFIVIKDKEYKIFQDTYHDNKLKEDIDYEYVYLNGKYYYKQNGKFTIDNWLQKETSIRVVEKEIIGDNISGNILKLDTVAWIEDGFVTVDGERYEYDTNLKGLKLEGGEGIIDSSGITDCGSIEFYPYTNSTNYNYVTKFTLTKGEEIEEPFEKISFVKRFYYIFYKNNYLGIYKDDNEFFLCDISNELLGDVNTGVTTFSVYTDVDMFDGTITVKVVSGDTFDVLKENLCYVVIDDNKYYINYSMLNANNGDEIAIYLDNQAYHTNVGDMVRLVDSSANLNQYNIYSAETNSGDIKEFILFRGERYEVIPNLCDKAVMDGNEYDIEYLDGNECIVHGENVNISMRVMAGGNSLEQKGFVVNGTLNGVQDYLVNHYDGVIVGDTKYLRTKVNDIPVNFIEIGEQNEYRFYVTEVVGSSMLICKPYLDTSDFSEEFIKEVSLGYCNYVVENQRDLSFYNKNNMFGKRDVTKELGISTFSGSTSSNAYFDLFENLSIYTPSAKILIPLQLSETHGSDLLLDDTVDRDFFEYEKKKAINEIIDMEKDVYYPKYFEGKYKGSETEFKETREIKFNLHFRTRDLDSWKINDSYNDAEKASKDLCNWFVTDFYPYKNILSSKADQLMNTSDLMGLLNFTNNDIYYQKSRVSKSFLRLSYYDSTNQQTQNLLATSTVFMNEHKLFKTFIDNSRKGLFNHRFLQIQEVCNNESNVRRFNKISVDSEYLNVENGGANNVALEEEHRVDCGLSIKSKYETDTSSEGFYIYMFREYSENLTPKPIYMKVEFNHAGVGRTLQFIVPMKWKNPDDNKMKKPNRMLKLEGADLDELKKGVKLEDAYMCSYIPLYAVYDFKNKEYAYVFDERYVTINDEGRITLNLFEIKYADDQEVTEDIQKNMTYGRQPTTYIDMNPNMFDDIPKTCDV